MPMSAEQRANERRVLLVPPTRRDGEVLRGLLAQSHLSCEVVASMRALGAEVERGVGVLVLTDAALREPHTKELLAHLARQPAWSEIPTVLLCRSGAAEAWSSATAFGLRNATILDRPTSTRTLLSSIQAGLRARARQYQLRDQIEALEKSTCALRERERHLSTVTEHIPDLLSRLDHRGRHLFVNRATVQLMGVDSADMLGRTHRELGMAADLSHRWEREVQEVFATGEARRFAFTHATDSGERRFLSLLVPEAGEDGGIETVLSVSHDVTETLAAKAKLENANRLKDVFLAMLAHELRNPLAPIRSATEFLASMLTADKKIANTVDILKRQVTHLTRLVDDLLDVSRISEGRVTLQCAPVEVSALVAQSVENVSGLVREKNHTLIIEASSDGLYVNGDHDRLVQSLSNLLVNAAKYSEPGGEIRIRATREQADVVIEVSDKGVGIAPALLTDIFGLFVQADRALDRSQGGLGIGLSVVKRLVEMHSGQVTASSGGAGQGASFKIRLPLIDAPALAQTAPTTQPPATPRRILIVDDNADAADTLATLLSVEGHETVAIYGASEAIERAPVIKPEVILLDIGLPQMDGYEVAIRLRRLLDGVSIVALTGYGRPEDKKRARQAGFDAHLVKPVDYAELNRFLRGTPVGE